jgi:hypothetical protein
MQACIEQVEQVAAQCIELVRSIKRDNEDVVALQSIDAELQTYSSRAGKR